MKKRFPQVAARFFPLIAFYFFLCGFSNPSLKDIETAIIEENYQKAEKLAKDFIATKPAKVDFDEALYYQGLSELRLEHFEDARNAFNLLISGFPKENLHDKAYLGYIDALYMDGKYAQALKITEELLSKSPRSEFLSLIYLKLARANLKLAQWLPAKNYLFKILSDFPDSLEAFTAKQLLEEKQYFAVQIGAFLEQARAEKLVSELKQKGEYAYIVETMDRAQRKFYRVRVGMLTVLDEAQKLQIKLAQLGYPASIYP